MRIGLNALVLGALSALAGILGACATGIDQSPSELELSKGFSAEVYLPPMPTLARGGAMLDGCPNPTGLDKVEGVTDDAAVSLLDQLWSGDANQARRASDPGLWPILGDITPRDIHPQLDWLDGQVRPASESPYASSLVQQCGEAIVQAAWTFTIYTPECKAYNSSSLEEDFFLISRGGKLLVWAVWP